VNPGANREWVLTSPYERFFDFIAPQADRFGILLEHIQKLGLNSVVISVEEGRHFFIFPRNVNLKFSRGVSFPFRGLNPVMLTAHYDRVPDSPGANDNSAAVFQLLKTALLLGKQDVDRWVIIFTDKEELQKGERIQNQGAYSLAKKLKKWGLANARIFNFDACGAGDTFVISATADRLLSNQTKAGLQRARLRIKDLREQALACARHLSKVLLLPTPFSDDAGFMQGGIPVQTITMLPANEAAAFASLLRIRPLFADAVIAGSLNESGRKLLPETWRCINGPSDSHTRLTPEHYNRIVRFAADLCRK